MIKQYRKKPVVIEAVRWHLVSATDIINWILENGGTARYHDEGDGPDQKTGIYIDTLEGTIHASMGDYIIKGVKGEFYPCKPDIFDATYEEVAS